MTDWRNDLSSFLDNADKPKPEEEKSELSRFITGVAAPAFDQLRKELVKHGREVNIRNSVTSIVMVVSCKGEEEISYRVQGRTFPNKVLPFAEVRMRERKGLKYIRLESMFRTGPPDYILADLTEDDIIQNFLGHYKRSKETD